MKKKLAGCRRRSREGRRMEGGLAQEQEQLVEVMQLEEQVEEEELQGTTTAMKSELSVNL